MRSIRGFSIWEGFLSTYACVVASWFAPTASGLTYPGALSSDDTYKSYKGSTIINYDSEVVLWGIFKSGTTLES